MAWRLSASDTTAPASATAAYRSGAVTVTTLMILSARCALMMLADLLHADWPGCRRERGRVGKVASTAPDGYGDVVAAEWFVHVWHGKSGL